MAALDEFDWVFVQQMLAAFLSGAKIAGWLGPMRADRIAGQGCLVHFMASHFGSG